MAVAGPIAGFAVALPFACYGILHTRLNFEPVSPGSVLFGYPLVVKGLQILLTGHTFTSVHVLEHPTFFAAWFGFLVTALNLIPAGQLDGGHTLFAVSPIAHRALRWPVVAVLAAAGWFLFPAWGLWAVIVIVMGRFGRAQLRDAESPLGPRRVALAVLVTGDLRDQPRSGPVSFRRSPRAALVRHEKVAGPSFTSSTSIAAPKLPVATVTPEARRTAR